MTLKDDLMDIPQVGESRAEEIIEVVEEHSTDSQAQENVEKALEELDEGRPGYARKFLERVVDDE